MTEAFEGRIVPETPFEDGQELDAVVDALIVQYPDFAHRITGAMRDYHRTGGGPDAARNAHSRLAQLEDQAIEGV